MAFTSSVYPLPILEFTVFVFTSPDCLLMTATGSATCTFYYNMPYIFNNIKL